MSKTKESKVIIDENGANSSTLKPCFIITPIGKQNSDENIKARGLINSVITPELEKYGFYPLPAYEIKNSGDINNQVIQNILDNELVIANLTGLNPNVMYELAIRHAVRKKVIMMTEHTTVLPFDIHNQRTIFYTDSFAGSIQAKEDLNDAIFATLNEEIIDNPIYKATELKSIIDESSNKSDKDLFTLLFERLDNIEGIISKPMNGQTQPKGKIETNKFTFVTVSYKDESKTTSEIISLIKEKGDKNGIATGIAYDKKLISNITFTIAINGERSKTDRYIADMIAIGFNVKVKSYADQ